MCYVVYYTCYSVYKILIRCFYRPTAWHTIADITELHIDFSFLDDNYKWQPWHTKFKKFMLFHYFLIFAFMYVQYVQNQQKNKNGKQIPK